MNRISEVRWGIIGCGDVTEKKSGPAFNKVDNSKLIAVMRRSKDKAKDYAKRHKVPLWYSDARELLGNSEINAVYIATPPNTHAKYAIMAAKAGKHIYVEKPMALNNDETVEMIETAKKHKVALYIAYYRRELEYFKKVKKIINSNIIGKPLFVNLKLFKSDTTGFNRENLPWRYRSEISGGGLFVDLGSHQLDILDYFFGRILSVNAIVENQANLYSVEDTLTVSFKFESGVIGNGMWSFIVPKFADEDSIEIIGERGRIKFSTFQFTPILLETQSNKEIFEYKRPEPIQESMIEKIVKNLISENRAVDNSEVSARATYIIQEILRDFYKKKC